MFENPAIQHALSVNHDADPEMADPTELTPLLSNKNNKKAETLDSKKKKPGVSFMKVLLRTYGADLLYGNIWQLFYTMILFVNPFLLK